MNANGNGLTSIGEAITAYLGTHLADIARAEEHDTTVQVSAAEVDLAGALRRAGVEDWEQQAQIGPYYVDFLFDRRFVVEVDGAAYHADTARERARDDYLLFHGARRIWHFPAAEVLLDAAGVVRKIVTERERLRAELRPDLPITRRYRPRPIMARLARRMTGRPLWEPTDEEKRDAIDVLRDGPDGDFDPLYREAERIFAEAGQ